MRFRVGKGSLAGAALVLAALSWSQVPQASYDSTGAPTLLASETVVPPNRDAKPKERPRGTLPKCPEGGERVPEKRSPYDSIAPLSPLVA